MKYGETKRDSERNLTCIALSAAGLAIAALAAGCGYPPDPPGSDHLASIDCSPDSHIFWLAISLHHSGGVILDAFGEPHYRGKIEIDNGKIESDGSSFRQYDAPGEKIFDIGGGVLIAGRPEGHPATDLKDYADAVGWVTFVCTDFLHSEPATASPAR